MKYRRCGILQATLSLSFMYSYSFCSKYFTLINNLSMFTVSSFLSKSKKILYSMFIILLVFKFNKYIGRIEFAKFVPSKTAKYIHTQPTNLKNCSLKSSLFFKGLLQLHRNNLFRDRFLCFSSLSSANVSLQLFYIFFRFCLPLNAC